ncbi:MAG: tRNA pseudouridine(38-40) synthase TruA [Propionibacteriaceae bacterium]|nr:tRNA pseudouridine(38-40) synthase TruA [Propionibacteriaceae bacterium]
MKVRIDLAYDGTGFSGWARQVDLRTVQGVLEDTIAQVMRLSEPAMTVCAGRTDAGVHARGQVVHVDFDNWTPPARSASLTADEALRQWLPRALPDDIVIRQVRVVPSEFDARFSALERRYVYRLWDSLANVDPLTRGYTLALPHHVNLDAMVQAAQHLTGLHDFVAFCRPKEHGTSIRDLKELSLVRRDSGLIEITARADAFCHSMVRSLVGCLVTIGRGQRDIEWVKTNLLAQARVNDIIVMPAHGLTLEEVTYPSDEDLGLQAERARTRREIPR